MKLAEENLYDAPDELAAAARGLLDSVRDADGVAALSEGFERGLSDRRAGHRVVQGAEDPLQRLPGLLGERREDVAERSGRSPALGDGIRLRRGRRALLVGQRLHVAPAGRYLGSQVRVRLRA